MNILKNQVILCKKLFILKGVVVKVEKEEENEEE